MKYEQPSLIRYVLSCVAVILGLTTAIIVVAALGLGLTGWFFG